MVRDFGEEGEVGVDSETGFELPDFEFAYKHVPVVRYGIQNK